MGSCSVDSKPVSLENEAIGLALETSDFESSEDSVVANREGSRDV